MMLCGQTARDIAAHAQSRPQEEICGFVLVDGRYLPLDNVADKPSETFEIAPRAWREDVAAIVHSHPAGEPFLSGADRQSQVLTGLPWVLYTGGCVKVFRCCPHLRGRVFDYGVADCGALVRDAYMLAGIDLPDGVRTDLDGDAARGRLPEHLAVCGFAVSDGLEAGDVLLTVHGGKPSHLALYLGQGRILHHAYNQLSRRERLTDWWRERIHSVWRHPLWQAGMVQAVENDLLHTVDF